MWSDGFKAYKISFGDVKGQFIACKPLGDFVYFRVQSIKQCFEVLMGVKILVSSAKSMNLRVLDVFIISLIYTRNNKGPRIDPWGTPHTILEFWDLDDLNNTYCFLLDK